MLSKGSLISERYLVEEVIGRGSQGMVYACKDQQLGGLKVALKVFPPLIKTSTSRQKQLKRELSSAIRIDHDNIVRLYDLLYSDQLVALVMEFIDGKTLYQIIREDERLPLPRVLNIMRQVALGLQQIHEKGILHRDMKPENILVTKDHRAKLSDFGISTIRESVEEKIEEGKKVPLLGTPYFMSPEYFESRSFDERSDIYAFGLVLFETITGRQAFREKEIQALYREKVTRGVTPPHLLRQDCPKALSDLCVRCVSIEPENRPFSIDEVVAELNMLVRGSEIVEIEAPELDPIKALKKKLVRKVRIYFANVADRKSATYASTVRFFAALGLAICAVFVLRLLPGIIDRLG